MHAPLTPRGAFGQSAMARASEVVGTVLGGRDLLAGMRWEHLADDVVCFFVFLELWAMTTRSLRLRAPTESQKRG
eukprot:3520330-Prymnesium_polylepis.1